MRIIDTHTHLFDKAFDEDRDEVITRAMDAGVEKMLCPAIDSGTHKELFALCEKYKGVCFPMMGLHPTHVNDNPKWRDELKIVQALLADPPAGRFIAVGEIGLDLYWSKDWQKEQEEAFRKQIELSIDYDLPIAVHTRNAWKEMTAILKDYASHNIRGVMHSFSGSEADYHFVKECGDFVFGIGGVATYKNSGMTELIEAIPLEDMVLETDSPYLTPVPYRGKRNESLYLKLICHKVAEIKGTAIAEVAAKTTANAERIFAV